MTATHARQPHSQDTLYLVNETLITAIGEWDKGPHDINKILQLLRACPASHHTSPPAPVKMGEISKICKLCNYETDCKEHDAQVAKAAREQVLEMLIKAKESQGKHDGYAGVVLDPIIESLRSTQQQAGDQHE